MFGELRAGVKNLLAQANTWRSNQTWLGTGTFSYTGLNLNPGAKIQLINTTLAQTGAQQVSPGLVRQGQGYKTTGTPGSQPVAFRDHVLPIQSLDVSPYGVWKFQSSINSAAYTDLLDLYMRNPDGNTAGRMDFAGALRLNFNQSNSDPATSKALELVNGSGSYTNLNFQFGATIKSAITVGSVGDVTFKTVNGGQYVFNFGATVTSGSLMVQIYSGGIYNVGGSFNGGKVTAGQADTSPPAYLNTYGSFAARYTYSNAATITFNENSTLYYLDPSTTICSGTAQVCSTWTGAGEATCNSHSGVGCTWVPAVTGACSISNYTDSGTCLATDAACSWSTGTCATYNNDASGCAAAGWPTPPYCSFTPAVCADFAGAEATCNSATGCAADLFDCTTLSDGGGDGTACATHPLCTYDNGTGVCSGNVYEGSCSGTYVGADGVCSGADFDTGVCAGTWTITPAACTGTASCSNLPADGTCTAETPCTISTGLAGTLPLSSLSNEGGTSRLYTFVHIGASGTATISAGAGSTIMQYPNLTLYKKGDKVSVQNVITTAACSTFVTEGSCTPSGCTWNPAIVCTDYNGNQTECNNHSGDGCTYDEGMSTCSGAGTAASCSGTYTSADMWVPSNYDRSKNYVEKTAAYTITNEDDVVNWTSGTVAATLPLSADIVPARPIYLKNRGAGTITLNTTSSQLIDGNASGVLTITTGLEKQLFPLAAGWIIL